MRPLTLGVECLRPSKPRGAGHVADEETCDGGGDNGNGQARAPAGVAAGALVGEGNVR